jgi:CDGSH-type Zn-finger protein
MSAKTTESGKTTKEEGREETKMEGPQGFAQMCGCGPSGEMPECCGPAMREMMSRCFGERQGKEEK